MLIFQHIPKAAGTALVDSLITRFSPWEVAFCYDHDKRQKLDGLTAEKRDALKLICGHHVLGLDAAWNTSACFYYTMLRDPSLHFISMYHYKQRQGEEPYAELPFDAFVHDLQAGRIAIDDFGHMIDNIQVRYLNRRFLEWSMDPLRNAHCVPADFEEARVFVDTRCRAVGITERFEESLGILGGLLGGALPLLRSNTRPDSAAGPSPALQGFLNEYHHLDRCLYDHAVKRLNQDVERKRSVPPRPGSTRLHRWRARAYRLLERTVI